MGFFDFIKQHNRVGASTDLLGQLPPFFKSHISRRSTNQSADIVLLHVFAHVDLDQGILITKHEFRQGFRGQCFSDTGWTGKQKHTGRSTWVFQAAAAASDTLGDLLDRFVLAHNTSMQFFFHAQQTNRVFTRKACQWNTSHLRDNFRDDFCVNDPFLLLGLVTPILVNRFLFLLQLVSLITQRCRFLKVLIRNRLFFGGIQTFDFPFKFFQIGGTNHRLQSNSRTRLVDYIDRLIGKAARGDVAS